MTNLQPFWHQSHRDAHARTSIIDALDMWSSWHCDHGPLGATGDYALDMLLADAFRALLYRPELASRLSWIEREIQRPRRRHIDDRYHAEIISWWLLLWEEAKLPGIESRYQQRRLQCVS